MIEATRQPVALAPNEGDDIWFIDNLATIKVAGAETEDRVTLLEVQGPKGHMPPLHVHLDDDEIFYLLDGEITFFVGDEVYHGTRGTTVLAPRGIAHTFRIESQTGTWLVIGTPAGFERFVGAVGTTAGERVIPNPALPFDPARAAEVDYRVEILGPPGTLPTSRNAD
jgi:quercetin dioxygenase-like cupin family protein